MALTIDHVVVELEAKIDAYNRNVISAQRQFDQAVLGIQSSAERTENRVVSSFRNMAGSLALLAGTTGAVAAVRGMLNFAESAKALEAQLRLATAQSGNFAQAQEDVRRIATETRSGLQETADLYAAFQRNARDLGISQQQVAAITRTVGQAFVVSGTGAGEAAQATRQLVQAFQSGVLRGDEFNSVMENAPRLARLLAESLGVPVGQLRRMAEEGELTAQKLATALSDTRFTAGLEEEFRQMPVTFDQAMTQITNAAIITFGAFDRGGQFSQALANFATQGSEALASIERDAEHAGATIRGIMEGLSDIFVPMVGGAQDAFFSIRSEAQGLSNFIRDLLQTWDSAAYGLRETVVHSLGAIGGVSPMQSRQWLPPVTQAAPTFQAGVNRAQARVGTGGAPWWAQIRPAQPRLPPPPAGGGGRRRVGGGGGRTSRRPEATAAQQRDAFELENFIADMTRETGDLRMNADELWASLQNIVTEGAPSLEQAFQSINASMPDLATMLTLEDQRRLEGFAEGFHRDLADGLAAAIVYGENLGDVLINTFRRAAAELLSSGLVQLLNGGGFGGKGGTGGVIGFISSAVGSLFGGGRAAGGPVSPNRIYEVGERGRELFVPDTAGRIVPQSFSDPGQVGMAGSMGGRLDVYVHAAEDFYVKTDARAAGIAVTVYDQREPGTIRSAAAKTMAAAGRPRLNR